MNYNNVIKHGELIMEDKKCENCKYFLQHFTCSANRFFLKTNCGHCVNKNFKSIKKNTFIEKNSACNKWEPKIELLEKRKEAIETVLRRMAKDICDIRQILKLDSNKNR